MNNKIKLNRKDFIFFFLGVDCAPSEAKNSDDSAFIINCAQPRVLPEEEGAQLSPNPADWFCDFIYARRFTYKQKATTRQLSGAIHELHRRFRFERIMMDPQQGGIYVQRDLREAKQLINGVLTDCTPIADQVDGPTLVVRGDFILNMFRRSDPGVEAVWTGLRGEDNFIDAMYSQMKDDFEHALVGMPENIEDWLIDPERKQEVLAWPEEKRWALQNLGRMAQQFQNVKVTMKADDEEIYFITKNGAKQFSALGKKDFVTAAMLSRLAFLSWLKSDDWRRSIAPEDAAMCGMEMVNMG